MTSLKKQSIARALAVLAALALPALAAAPVERAQPAGLRRASMPAVDLRDARVIVKYKADGALMRETTLSARDPDRVPVQFAARMSQRLGLAVNDGRVVAPRTQVLRVRNMSSAELVARLQADPDVEYAEVDERMRIVAAPNDPLYRGGQPANVTPTVGQWYLRIPDATIVSAINAEAAWNTTKGSPAIVVALLDTGVRPDHPDLAGKLMRGYDFVSADLDGSFASSNDGDGRDGDASDPGDWVTQDESSQAGGPLEGCDTGPSSWHGTQTAALIGAATDNGVGMASVGRNVRVMPVRVLGKCGGFMSDVIAAMYWAAGVAIPPTTRDGFALGTAPSNPTPAKVLNLSLGSTTPTCGFSYQDAVTAVNGNGASVVVAAGNDEGLAVGRPANCAGAIAVGGLRHTGTKVGFSDVGPEVALSAPGGNCVNDTGACLFPILSASNTGTTVPAASTYTDSFGSPPAVGTSFSAPLVAGTAALMLSRNPTLSPAQVRATLMAAARAFPQPAGIPACHAPNGSVQDECSCTTSTCGAGMLDAAAAVAAVSAPSTTQALAFATPAAPAPGATVTLDGSTSVPGSSRTITGYQWTLVDSGGIANLALPTNAASAVVTTSGGGTFTVRLDVTDDSGSGPVSTTLAVTAAIPTASPPSGGGGGGGGMLSWPWLLALCAAVGALRPRRS